MPARYTIDHANVAKLLYGKAYYPDMIPIYWECERRAQEVARKAKIYCPKRTGATAASITSAGSLRIPYWNFQVEAHTPYSYWLHQGTRPHMITATMPGGDMAFREGSRIVHARVVNHPGTHKNPFLAKALPAWWGLGESRKFLSLSAAEIGAFT